MAATRSYVSRWTEPRSSGAVNGRFCHRSRLGFWPGRRMSIVSTICGWEACHNPVVFHRLFRLTLPMGGASVWFAKDFTNEREPYEGNSDRCCQS